MAQRGGARPGAGRKKGSVTQAKRDLSEMARTGWSNAQVEGQVNKLKLLKRSMYGRASLDLLRRRLILAA